MQNEHEVKYENEFKTTGKVLSEPIKLLTKNVMEFDILYKEKVKYTVNVSGKKEDLMVFLNSIKVGDFINISGKLQLINATPDYIAYILIHAETISTAV